jgi:hypothetical protein
MSDLLKQLPQQPNIYQPRSAPPTAPTAPVAPAPVPTAKPAQALYFVNAWVDMGIIGGLSLLTYLVLRCVHDGSRANAAISLAAMFLWLVNWPHFSATNYRLYHSRDNIWQYPITALLIPWFILAALLGSIWAPLTLAPVFVKLFLIWSPYHFSGQTVGITLVYARRTNYQISPWQRWGLFSFVFGTFMLSFALGEVIPENARPDDYFNNYYGIKAFKLGLPAWLPTLIEVWMWTGAAVFFGGAFQWMRNNARWLPFILFLPALAQYFWFLLGPGTYPFQNVKWLQPLYEQLDAVQLAFTNTVRGWLGWEALVGGKSYRRMESFVEFVPFFHSMQYLLLAWSMQLKERMDQQHIAPSWRYVATESARWGGINVVGGALLFLGFPFLMFWLSSPAAWGLSLREAGAIAFWSICKPMFMWNPFTDPGWHAWWDSVRASVEVTPASVGLRQATIDAANTQMLFVTGLVLVAVQIHHFFVDGVIWKLKKKTVSSPLMVNLDEMVHVKS